MQTKPSKDQSGPASHWTTLLTSWMVQSFPNTGIELRGIADFDVGSDFSENFCEHLVNCELVSVWYNCVVFEASAESN